MELPADGELLTRREGEAEVLSFFVPATTVGASRGQEAPNPQERDRKGEIEVLVFFVPASLCVYWIQIIRVYREALQGHVESV